MKNFPKFIQQLFQDKNGHYSLRELVSLLFIIVIVISWIAQQFFHLAIPEFMFFSFVSLVSIGCFGYSIERRSVVADPAKSDN